MYITQPNHSIQSCKPHSIGFHRILQESVGIYESQATELQANSPDATCLQATKPQATSPYAYTWESFWDITRLQHGNPVKLFIPTHIQVFEAQN